VRAVVLTDFGPPGQLVLAELPDPVAGPGEVVIAVDFAGVTFVETQIRSGHPPHPAMAPVLPVVLGNGVGGTVVAVGPGTAADFAHIDRQFVTTTGGSGGYAESVAVPASELIPVPAGVPIDQAVALLADGRTAMALMQSAAIRPGETVLVEAAAGGVGSLLVQLARNAGATVVAAAGGLRKVQVVAGLGAATAVDYQQQRWPEAVMAAVGRVDVVFDGVGGPIGAAAFSLLRDGGKICMFGMASGSFTAVPEQEAAARNITVLRGVPVTPARARELTASALDAAVAGAVHPLIGQRFELADAAQAHAAIESRSTIGKTLLTVS
jgi:NADPH2:quinone reductase